MTDQAAQPAAVGRRAMILAAGLGLRMHPLTATVPKPLIELAGKPLIAYALDRLKAAGVERIVVNVHHLPEQIERWAQAQDAPQIVISDERERLLDTGGGIAHALPLLGNEPFVVLNSDSVWIEGAKPALDRMRQAWRGAQMDALLLVSSTARAVGYGGPGDFHLDPEGRLTRRAPNQVAPFVFAGCYLAAPRLFAAAPEGPFSMNLLWDRALAAGRLYGIRHDGLWLHVGTPEAIAPAERALADVR
jgi:MurNAc alpha-1-phosphate uridylyltransferase